MFGISSKNIDHIHLMEVMAGTCEVCEDGKWDKRELFMTAGEWYMTVCGTGPTVKESRDEAYSIIDQVVIPNSPGYRHDIGERLKDAIPKLKAMGFCKEWVYGSN